MDEFEAAKIRILKPVLFEAGAGLQDSQALEYSIKYLLYLLSKAGVKGLDPDRAVRIIEDEERKTAGQLIGLLKEHIEFSPDFEGILTQALRSRNRLVHNFLSENLERIVQIDQQKALVSELRQMRKPIRHAAKILDELIVPLARVYDNLDLVAIGHEIRADFLRKTERN